MRRDRCRAFRSPVGNARRMDSFANRSSCKAWRGGARPCDPRAFEEPGSAFWLWPRQEFEGRTPAAIAVTNGPRPCVCPLVLAIGVASAKALSLSFRVPLIGVNHLRGHVWSAFIAVHAADPEGFQKRLDSLLPHLGLVVSGGNTLLFEIDRTREIRVISTTRDDAAGEALDKGAKLLGLGYPGGPLIEKLCASGSQGRL